MADQFMSPEKKEYAPPRATIISLRPEEAVLGNCKSFSTAGPVQSTCHQAGGGGNCQGIGS
jgi:hypothetical protein